ncbi:MAG: alpha/beta fold hydrolase [bacterium]
MTRIGLSFGLLLIAAIISCKKQPAGDKATQTPSPRKPSGDASSATAATPEARARSFVALLDKGAWTDAEGQLGGKMRSLMPAAKLKATWTALTAQVGAYKSVKSATSMPVKGHTVVRLTTDFARAQLIVQVSVARTGTISGLYFMPVEKASPYKAPPYAKPGSYTEVAVTVGTGDWKLPGTLSLPKGVKAPPVLVLVHGSGPHDRDETIGPNKPFKDLALGLVARGIAVLRYDKRTKAKGQAFQLKYAGIFTGNEVTVDDAVAAAKLLRRDGRVDPKRIFVLGHSLGGYFLPRIGKRAPHVAGLISMAGSTRPLEDLIVDQLQYISTLGGKRAEEVKKLIPKAQAAFKRVRDPKLSATTPAKDLPLGIPAPFWLDVRHYDPARLAGSLPQPLLVLSGARDYQVTAKDFEGWKKGLAGRKKVTYKRYPRLNHLFMPGEGKPRPEEYGLAGHVDPVVIADIAEFVLGPK